MTINEWLKDNNYKAVQLAKDIGVNKSTVSRMASGFFWRRSKDYFVRLNEATGLTPNDILGIHPEPQEPACQKERQDESHPVKLRGAGCGGITMAMRGRCEP